jgi:hypothetical protein
MTFFPVPHQRCVNIRADKSHLIDRKRRRQKVLYPDIWANLLQKAAFLQIKCSLNLLKGDSRAEKKGVKAKKQSKYCTI